MQVHVVSALKGAGLFNSYKLCTVFDYDTLTCHDGFSIYKARPKLHGGHVSVSAYHQDALAEHRRPADTERG
jgi:hypothetical protein